MFSNVRPPARPSVRPSHPIQGISDTTVDLGNFSVDSFDTLTSGNFTSNSSDTSSLENALSSISELLEYGGPLPVLPFDVFVGLTQVLSSLAGTDNLDAARFYADIATGGSLGRLLKLGKLSFAVGASSVDDDDNTNGEELTEEQQAAESIALRGKVQHLVDYLNTSTVYFRDVFFKVWDSEDEAVESALSAGVGLYEFWAVVVFDKLDPGDVDYTIRMNYTVVPDTGEVMCVCVGVCVSV